MHTDEPTSKDKSIESRQLDGPVASVPKAPYHILIVEDDPGLRSMLELALRGSGYRVSEAADGSEALTALRQQKANPPDLILLDLMLPTVSGLKVLETIRGGGFPPKMLVIVLTAANDADSLLQAFALGANDYLTKPFKLEELRARIDSHITHNAENLRAEEALLDLRLLDDLKDKSIRIAAHDLRGPLATIHAGLQLLADERVVGSTTFEAIQPLITSMTIATKTMNGIIDDFLDLEAIRVGRLSLKMDTLSLNDLVERTVEMLRPSFDRKEIKVNIEMEQSSTECLADEGRLTQVLGNLLTNAINYSPRGTPVTVRTRKMPNALRVEVQDRGMGIGEDEMHLLFMDFTRLKNVPTDGESQRGLGLSISRQLVELHNGKVGAESKRGIGSLFWFELPLPESTASQS